MKKMISACLVVLFTMLCFGCVNKQNESYLRIHIRANSNLEIDQNVKYKVKDFVVDFLTPIIAECNSFEDVKLSLENNKTQIENVCNNVLKTEGFSYVASASITNEYFPTRAYGNYVLESDFYDALVIELGEASGDNWWCVVYPPLCFLDAKNLDLEGVKYKSKLVELINNFFD